MAKYVQFDTGTKDHLLVEVNEAEPPPAKAGDDAYGAGTDKAGLLDMTERVVAKAQTAFGDAVETALRANVETFYSAIKALPAPPSEIEITFALKATGELSNLAVGKLGAESNYTVKLTWRAK